MVEDDKALVERLRGDWPEILVEKHWMMDSDAIDKQREEAADRIEALNAEIERLKWEMRLAENLLSDCQKHLYGEGIAPPENVIAGIRERLK